MVRLHFSLLAVTLATGSALASSNDYQRPSELDANNKVHRQLQFRFGLACARAFNHNNLQSRGFEDEEDLFVRDLDTFDDLEAREPFNFGSAIKFGKKAVSLGKKASKHQGTRKVVKGANRAANAVDTVQQINGIIHSRGLEDNEDLFGRDLDTFDDLEAREPFNFGSAIKFGKKAVSLGRKASKHQGTRKAVKGAKRAAKGANRAANAVDTVQQINGIIHSRDLEDNEDLFGRDLDAEEFFGREYDLLDERDTIDDLD